MITIPPYLQKGDTIGIICPSGFMPADKMQTCITVLQDWGFRVKKGLTAGAHFHYFSGTDAERLQDLQQMINDPHIKAILCARGGYGLSRIIDDIDFIPLQTNPKWIIGYSDITILHSHLFQQQQIASLHSPMAAAFNDHGYTNEYVKSLLQAITGNEYIYKCAPYKLNRQGVATGELVGGNLCLLGHLVGSKSSADTAGKILFIEDIGEYLYNVDRLMIQLKRTGKLSDLAGLIVGNFTDMKDTTIPFGESVYDIIFDKVKEYNYPVCFDFPVGHSDKNYALKHGATHTLEVYETNVMLRSQ